MAMEHDTAMTWSEPLPEETLMATGNEDDFSNFLEFGIDFADLDGHNAAAAVQHQQAMQHANHHIATTLADDNRVTASGTQAPQYAPMMSEHLAIGIPNNHFSQDQQQFHQQQQQHQSQHQQQHQPQSQPQHQQHHQHPQQQHQPQHQSQHQSQHQHAQQQQHIPRQHPQHSEKLIHQRQQHPHQQMGGHNYQEGQHIIPPTPNSVELHGGAARYVQRVEQGNELYERYSQVNDEQANAFYTPLVSPAMTPLETQFRLPEYTIPGEYFTPLTSPALEAQNSNSNGYPFQTTQPQQTSSGFVTTSVDANGLTMTSAPPSPAVFKKQRQARRPSTATRAGGRAAKASPSFQAKNWRNKNRNLHITDDLASNNSAVVQDRATNNGHSALRYSSNESSQDSVSPEPISEPLMPPPALPHKSPAIVPQVPEANTSAPATPATLMRIHNRSPHTQDPSGQFSGNASLVTNDLQDEPMEDVVLPEAVTDTRPRPSRINTNITSAKGPSFNDKSGATTPSMEPKSATSRRPSGSLTPGPHSGAMPSPSGLVPKKSESKALASRKRQSISSSHASPALRPRISPSIQPLVRGDSMSSESSALYLASKSNYQHILDGTVLPGVSYPETLAENLSSKRTNHKLAEQGRRNRINTALKEIESLLPPGFAQERASKESKEANGLVKSDSKENIKEHKEKNTPPTISKASTVEMAIDYIKALKSELEQTKAQLHVAETKLASQNIDMASEDTDTTADNSDRAAKIEPTTD